MKNSPSPSQKPPQKQKTFFQACHKTIITMALFDILLVLVIRLWLETPVIVARMVVGVLLQAVSLGLTYYWGLYEDRVLFGPEDEGE